MHNKQSYTLLLSFYITTGIAGDITPTCGVSNDEKYAREAAALEELKSILGQCIASDEIDQLWKEYEAGETNEAKLVKDFDKVSATRNPTIWIHQIIYLFSKLMCDFYHGMQLEMILQANEYEVRQGKDLQEFFDSTAGKWRTELGKSWAEEIYRRRSERRHD